MNIEIANRLVELRKKSGLSQEELADKLGLSRQAVSKWERAEASPDTDNLICLAKLYNVSLDDLLKTDVPIDDIVREQKEKTEETKKENKEEEQPKQEEKKERRGDHISISKDGIHVSSEDGDEVHISKEGIHIDDKDGEHVHLGPKDAERLCEEHKKKAKIVGFISSILSIGAIVAYLLLGFFVNTPWAYGDSNSGWCVGWLVFFLVPIVPSLVDSIIARRFTRFAFPVVVVTTYLALGMLLGLWHPTWVMFFAIPLYYIIFNPIDHLFDKRKLKKEFGVEGDVVLDIDDEDDEDDEDE